MDIFDWNIYVVQQITIEFNSVAAGHENHDLLLQVLSQKGEQKLESLGGVSDYHKTLLKICNC